MKLDLEQKSAIDKVARKCGLKFIRLFGSAVHSLSKARDIDVAVGPSKLDLKQRSLLVGVLEKLFHKKVDLVELGTQLTPVLIKEIASRSVCLWEEKRSGRASYAILIDKCVAIAEDESLGFSSDLKLLSLRVGHRRLRVP